MDRLLRKLTSLERQLNAEKDNYKRAIKNNQRFEDVKSLYMKIKQLRKEVDLLMKEANRKYQGLKKNSEANSKAPA